MSPTSLQWTGAIACFCLLSLILARIGHAAEGGGPVPELDCRYPTIPADPATESGEPLKGKWFPIDDVFRPILADPKERRFFASYQRVRFRGVEESRNAVFVGFGEYFGVYGWREQEGCDGMQVSVSGAVFSQFNLDAASNDLINSDFVIGVPFTMRRGLLSARLHVFHQSSHVGDEFLLNNPGFDRVNLSFEALEGLASFDHRGLRLYGGGFYLIHREPALDRGKLQWGVEARAAPFPSPLLGDIAGGLFVYPVFGADFQAFEQFGFNVATSLQGGVELKRLEGKRRLRLLLNYYRGRNPYGQFFNQKIESFGIGVSLEL